MFWTRKVSSESVSSVIGSQSYFITTDCIKSLGIKQISTHIPITRLGELSTQTRSLAKIMLQSRINGFCAEFDCLVINRISQALSVNHLNLEELEIPADITLADPKFNRSSDIDLLLGVEIFLDLLCIGKIKLVDDQPSGKRRYSDCFGQIHGERSIDEKHEVQPSY